MLAHRPRTTGRRSLLAVATLLALLGLGLPHPPWWTPTPPPGGLWAALGSAGTAHAQTTPPPATPTPTPAPRAPTRIIGDIAVNTTWARSASPFLVTNHLAVKDGAVLTIEAGVEVRVVNRARITVGKSNAGSLVAVGTATQPIVFTSTTATGSWAGLRMQSGTLATTRLEHVRIERSRYGIELSGPPSGIALRNVSIQHVEKDAIYFERTNPILQGLTISDVGEKALHAPDAKSFQLRDSTVRGALYLPSAVNPTLQNNTFHDLTGSRLPPHLVATIMASSAGTTPKTVVELTWGYITKSASWPALTYRVLGTIAVAGTATASPQLSLAPGTTFRFTETTFRAGGFHIPRLVVGIGLHHQPGFSGVGGLVAVGTAAAPIRFTADVTDPTNPFFWSGLILGSQTLATTRLEHIEIEGAETGISLNSTPAGITLRSGTIRRVRYQGIEVRNASPVFDGWTLDTAANKIALSVLGSQPFTLRRSTLHGTLHAPTVTSATLENNTFRSGFHAPKLETVNFSKNTFVNYGSSVSSVARIHPNLVADFLASIPNATADTVVEVGRGTLTRSVTWPVAAFRIVDRLTVEGTAAPTLTLTPGTTLRFTAKSVRGIGSLVVGSAAAGGLVAVGTAIAPIRFTADATPPVAGSWDGIALYSKTSATTRLEHIEVEFARIALYLKDTPAGVRLQKGTIRKARDEGIRVEDASPVLDGWTIITDVGRKSLHVTGSQRFSLLRSTLHGSLHVPLATSGTLEGNTFRGGFHVPSMASATFKNNTFVNYGASASSVARVHPNLVADVAKGIPGATAQTVIEVEGSTLSRSGSWPARTYRVRGRLAVGGRSSPTLTLAGGCVMRFAVSGIGVALGGLDIAPGHAGPGGIIVRGTSGQLVTFTSDADKPTAGSWDGITLHGRVLGHSSFDYGSIQYPRDGLRLRGTQSGVALRHGTIKDASRDGISFENTSPVLDGWSISKTGRHALTTEGENSFTLKNSSVLGSLNIPKVTSATVLNNTFSSAFVPRVHPNLVATFAAGSPGTRKTVIEVSEGHLSSSATWPARTYRITGTFDLEGSKAPNLTLTAGTTLRFTKGARLVVGDGRPGGLVAVGTAAAPIVFTTDAVRAAGAWRSIEFHERTLATSRMENVVIEFPLQGLILKNVPHGLTFRNGVIRHTTGTSVYIKGGEPGKPAVFDGWTLSHTGGNAFSVDHHEFILRNSVLHGVLHAPRASHGVLEGNTFHDATGGQLNANLIGPFARGLVGATRKTTISVSGGTIFRSDTWPAHIYRLTGALGVGSADGIAILTLEAGTTLRFAARTFLSVGSEVIRSGTTTTSSGLVAVGTPAAPILFTADAETPKAGSWYGISVSGSNAPVLSQLSGVTIEYADQGLHLNKLPPAMIFEDIIIRNISGIGVLVDGGAPTLSRFTISGAGVDGVYLDRFSGRIEHSTITGSRDDGVECSHPNYRSGINASRPVFLNNRISGNTGSGIACGAAAHIERNTITGNGVGVELTAAPNLLALHHNDLSGNTVPMKNTATGGVDARWNWWGSTAGPSGIVGKVRTSPWLGAAPTAPFRIEGAVASPESFAPGGSASAATVTAQTPQAATWSLTLRNGAGTTVRSFTGTGTSFAQDWDGKNTASQALPAGSYRYTLGARPSAAGGTAAAPVLGDITLVAGDLVAKIATPGHGARLTKATSFVVRGRSLGTGFSAYELDYAAGADPGASSFTRISRGTTAVATTGALGTWNTSQLSEGIYTLRLRTLGSDSAAVQERVTVALPAVGAVTISPGYFSPNDDGFLEEVTASAQATVRGDWTAQVRSASGIVVREHSGAGSIPRIVWDGRNTAGVIQQEGTYTVALRMAVDTGKPVEVTGAVILDVTPPRAIITAPAANAAVVDFADLAVTGTVSDTHFASYELRTVAGAGTVAVLKSGTEAVVAGTLGTLSDTSTAPRYVDGDPYTLELAVEDRAGNRTFFSQALRFERIWVSGVIFDPTTIDPEQDETTRISYELSRAARVTVQLVADREGGPTYTLIQNQSFLPGLLTTTWNGKDAEDKAVARDFYHLRITARDAAGRNFDYDASTLPVVQPEGVFPFWYNVRFDGKATLAEVDFSAYRNDELRIDYTLDKESRHTVEIWEGHHSDFSLGGVTIPLLTKAPIPAGENHVIWTGRRSNGKPYAGPFSTSVKAPEEVGDGTLLVWSPAFRIDSFRANPYVFQPVQGQVVHISYALQSAAKVQVDIVDPDGNHWLRLQEATVQQPGTHKLEWSGRNAAGQITALEGLYTIEVTATQTSGRKEQAVRRGNLLVYP